jgi:ribose-phosphate pyrophosphokinase
MDMHAAQIQGFFNIPVDELTALFILGNYWKKKKLDNLVVVATDIGISARARDMAARLGARLAIIEKRRIGNADATETLDIIGHVEGMSALTIDDEIDTAGSLVGAVKTLLEHGATEVYSCCTHPVFSGPALERIAKSPVKEVVVTDTLPGNNNKKLDKITVLPIAPLFGEAIHRIHTGLSVGALFE